MSKFLFREGKDNPTWKGEAASYSAAHKWASQHKPKPNPFICEVCGKSPAKQLANISGQYKRDVNDWKWSCVPCNHLILKTPNNKYSNFLRNARASPSYIDWHKKANKSWSQKNPEYASEYYLKHRREILYKIKIKKLKEMRKMGEGNFLEIENVEQANTIDMKIWKFITYDSGHYVFARRVKPLVK